MRKRILIATGVVASVTMLVGLLTAFLIANRLGATAEEELARQALVTAQLIEEDLEELRFNPGNGAPEQINRFRSELNRSLSRAQTLGGHDAIEAELRFPNRTIPINEHLEVIPSLPSDADEGEVVTVDVDGRPMLVALEQVDIQRGHLAVAIGRFQPLVPVKQLTVALLVALSIGAALTLSLGVWYARSLSTRLADISGAAVSVGGGDLTARATVTGRDEIADVAESFNNMAEELEGVRDREREFLMAVSHDLRTPLTTISGYAEALDAGDIPPEDLPTVAGVLHGQTDQLARLVEDLMALARVEASEFSLEPESVDVAVVVRSVVDSYAERAKSASIAITFRSEGETVAIVDPGRLIQVIGNLFDNALRYTPKGGDIIVACTEQPGSRTTIDVTNSGHGIAPSDVPHVFERLYVADRYRAQRPAGSGLGLAIVAELVDAMGGVVSCRSSEVDGTTFSVTIG